MKIYKAILAGSLSILLTAGPAFADTLYVTVKEAPVYEAPDPASAAVKTLTLGSKVQRSEDLGNGYSFITYEAVNEDAVTGYISNDYLSTENLVLSFTDEVSIAKDSDVLDFPATKEGEVVGEVLEYDDVKRTGTVDSVWSRILYDNEDGSQITGYIPTSVLEDDGLGEIASAQYDVVDSEEDTGTLHESDGTGVFADANENVTVTATDANGVQVGNAISVPEGASLQPLGTFRITHYCPCSICCGPYTNGITSTGVTATTNHTIAVYPSQIPYGSQVVINGQVYVAEDCGGGITQNCIDIYVATHDEAETKGVYYTDVYLIVS